MKFENDPVAGRQGEFEISESKNGLLGTDLFREYLESFLIRFLGYN